MTSGTGKVRERRAARGSAGRSSLLDKTDARRDVTRASRRRFKFGGFPALRVGDGRRPPCRWVEVLALGLRPDVKAVS
ncbi:Hypothetical protein NTJ_08087 [Nesidiocoris tenuis]|uniref:Uncharacterized protein n=1 Tax=Nesidiocoris tenuis TaxID=355587 RepID=A0ABN7ASU6_9HEMI|nr:Hypothetical protein NTJ_08087 [Nesidiocoris tenuis]